MDPRRIRVFFSDPEATDSDSGDSDTCAATKPAGKTEIIILQCNSSTNTRAKMNPAGCGRPQAIYSSAPAAAGSSRNHAVGSAPTTRRYRGAYERQPGRWAAEFRSHRLKVRHWVGTFATQEEAKAAYDAFERRFHSSPRSGLPASSSERGANAGGVRRASHPPPDDEKRQIVLALMTAATTRMLPPSSVGAMAASVSVPSAPCISSSTSASSPPTLFRDARRCDDDAPRSLHSIWADEPGDGDLVGLADLAHLPLPRFSDPSMDFDPADLSLFDNGFL
ncbi:dehydration-responsive element-binding protein 1E-like [Panicum miliaceum]|uniref:Dehydration-responsive element-binding protein 1E-like n=1 Tax=Panicum miliaceum TaxID=4540 RepID=A0A3L6PNN0_PANMI|nr:dehydration-responsive element-binding protein 1E-like [Panicum miliaceum]